MGFGYIVSVFTKRIILSQDFIEVSDIRSSRRLTRQEIGAKALLPAPVPLYVLYPWSKNTKSLMIEVAFTPDQTFQDWIGSIPNADKSFYRGRRAGTLEP